MTDLELYKKLFIHRTDVYAMQSRTGAYYPQRQPFTDDELAEHLDGIASYGTYVIRPEDQTVSFVVFDLDTHDRAAQSHLVHEVEYFVAKVTRPDIERGPDDQLARKALLYETSGNKGTHVWVFFSEPLPARQVRAWVEAEFMPQWKPKADENHWPLEVFPKQDTVDEGGFGNLVKLPLGKHAVSQQWSHLIPYQGWASQIEEVVPLDSSLVPEAPAVTHPPPRATGLGERGVPVVGSDPTSPFPCVDFIQREGAQQGYRDQAMFHLALYYYGHGLDEDLAEEMCLRANENFDPPMGDADIKDKVRSAYRGRYQSARCGTDWLRDICPGPCRAGWSVRKVEAGDLRSAQVGDAVEVEVVRRTSERGAVRVTVGHPDAGNQPTLILNST